VTGGSCVVLAGSSCTFGTYLGDGTTCTPNPCPAEGACCTTDGSCYLTTGTGCSHLSGVYKGNDTSCSTAGCPQPTRGACCFRDGACSLLTSADCSYAHGTYEGNGTVCSPNPCPQPSSQGACCNAQAACQITTQTACNAAHDLFLGNGSSCSPSPCISQGDSFLGIWQVETELKICGTDSVMYHATMPDTVCTLDDSSNPGSVECNYTNDNGTLVYTCINDYTYGSCTVTTTSVGRLIYGVNSYTMTGRSIDVSTGTDCTTGASCYDITVTGTKTGPPPTPCPAATLEEVLQALARHGTRMTLHR
jgi:hypothetical protein